MFFECNLIVDSSQLLPTRDPKVRCIFIEIKINMTTSLSLFRSNFIDILRFTFYETWLR